MSNDYFKDNINALDFSRSLVPVMKKIAEPLLINTEITNFSYLKFCSDGSVINLTTDMRWIDYRFSENIKYRILFEKQLEDGVVEKPYMFLWPKEINNKLLGALHAHGIWNGCNIYIPKNNQIEVFSFSSSVDNTNIQNFYINNFNFLNKFIVYFVSNMKSLHEAEERKNRIITDIKFPFGSLSAGNNKYNEEKKIFALKKIKITDELSLSNKEIECCYYLSKGLSIKGIANKMCLSPRTIETHVNHIKLKSNCCTTDLLIEFIHQKRWIFNSLFPNEL
ncbi:helix-turn-helix transcriptional regulator [Legionella geestiana]|uniref:helix-turn-helix transcriptional regulator n=1 Tax=Legionella geestiana TaxID=45065 RepID=UPI0010923133|nr:helix-turn-helix transcriptional regulator [Legionella geestiana]QDQ40192.1 helix-turn-helix transcriptional regulator [Legionella geestiana]